MGAMVAGGSAIINILLVFLMIAALILIIITAMAGSSRTLYQGSIDGWLPSYLSRVNHNGAPTAAMWTDLVFNLVLLSIASTDATAYYFILAVSNCGYIIFNFLNLMPAGSTASTAATSRGPTRRRPSSWRWAASSPS